MILQEYKIGFNARQLLYCVLHESPLNIQLELPGFYTMKHLHLTWGKLNFLIQDYILWREILTLGSDEPMHLRRVIWKVLQ